EAVRVEGLQDADEGLHGPRVAEQRVDQRPCVQQLPVVLGVVQTVAEVAFERRQMDRALPPDAHRVDAQDRLDEPMLILYAQRDKAVRRLPPTHRTMVRIRALCGGLSLDGFPMAASPAHEVVDRLSRWVRGQRELARTAVSCA